MDLDRARVAAAIRATMTAAGFDEGSEDRYTVTDLDGDKVTEQDVLDHDRKWWVKSTESLVCYFTGHGGFSPEKGHQLSMHKDPHLARQEMLAAMGRDNPRAVIVLTDCCANASKAITTGFTLRAPDPLFHKQLTKRGGGDVARDLFFKSRGVVNVTAASTGTSARGLR